MFYGKVGPCHGMTLQTIGVDDSGQRHGETLPLKKAAPF
jgi:hypothetical protein